ALDLARTQERALDSVLRRLPKKASVAALGITAQRSTIVLWDSKTGKPCAPALSWQDGRAAPLVAPLLDRQRFVHERTGLYLTPYYSAPKIRWLLENAPQVRDLAGSGRLRVGPISTYLLWRLTGGEVFAVDPTMAQRMLLLDIRSMAWDEELIALFGIPRESLPAILPTVGRWGTVVRGGRRIPVYACVGDQQSAAVGQGAQDTGEGVLNYGTGAFFLLHTGERAHRVPGLLTSVALTRESRAPTFFLEGTVHAAGTTYDWLRENLGILKDSKQADALCSASKAASKDTLWALPALGGLGAPRWDYTAPTVLFGLTPRTRRADIVRAMTEGLAFLVADIAAAAEAAGLRASSLKASGGLARMDYLLQFQADLLRRPIVRLRESEATAFGAATLAAERASLPWAQALRRAVADKEFSPLMPEAESLGLSGAWRVFVEGQRELAAKLAGA
ncbi:MAG: FGGY family carbohydrate kinase, partial [Elusimicrobiota bacterium]